VTVCHLSRHVYVTVCLSLFQARGVPVVDVNFTSFQETLDNLHDYLLQCMELAMSDGQLDGIR
jgi:hypothetical protein